MPSASVPQTRALAVAGGVLCTTFDEEVVLLNQADGVYYGLSDVGARVWALVERSASIARIRETIVAEYDVDAARCASDLDRLIAELVRRGLVVVASS
ncbi:MAG TPA: PqqD family protein [Vicinamibacterales bacterium]|nr:PqqD family protein [Vicinamibacterales bacterium]